MNLRDFRCRTIARQQKFGVSEYHERKKKKVTGSNGIFSTAKRYQGSSNEVRISTTTKGVWKSKVMWTLFGTNSRSAPNFLRDATCVPASKQAEPCCQKCQKPEMGKIQNARPLFAVYNKRKTPGRLARG